MFAHQIQVLTAFVSNSPNWTISTGIRAIVGSFLTDLPKLVMFPFQYFREHWFYGEWYHYFANRDHEQIHFVEQTMIVRRGIRHPFVFSRAPTQSGHSHYKGYVEFEKDFCLLKSKATKEDEQLFQRFRLTALSDRQTMVGLCCSQDYAGRASVNACVISRTRLGESEFFAVVRSRIGTDAGSRTMHIRI